MKCKECGYRVPNQKERLIDGLCYPCWQLTWVDEILKEEERGAK